MLVFISKQLKQMSKKIENLFIIGWGLAGGFGGIRDFEVIEAETEEAAYKFAWEQACECYESYVGSYGLRTIEEIMEEEGYSEEGAEEQYNEEREGWLDYSAVKFSKEAEKKVMGYHYHNPFKDITDVIS